MIERGQVGICAVCARQEAGFGVHVHPNLRRSSILWLCDDPECLEIAKRTKDMTRDEFNQAERRAVFKGGCASGRVSGAVGQDGYGKIECGGVAGILPPSGGRIPQGT